MWARSIGDAKDDDFVAKAADEAFVVRRRQSAPVLGIGAAEIANFPQDERVLCGEIRDAREGDDQSELQTVRGHEFAPLRACLALAIMPYTGEIEQHVH